MLTKNQEAAIKHGAKGGTGGGYRIGVMHVGAPACGMNAAARSFIRNAISTGHRAFGINNSLEVNICSVHAPASQIDLSVDVVRGNWKWRYILGF